MRTALRPVFAHLNLLTRISAAALCLCWIAALSGQTSQPAPKAAPSKPPAAKSTAGAKENPAPASAPAPVKKAATKTTPAKKTSTKQDKKDDKADTSAKQPVAPATPPAPPTAPAPAAAEKAPLAPRSLTRLVADKEKKQQFEKEQRMAILVAPSYLGSGLSHLRYTVADMLSLEQELTRQGYNVTRLGPSEATSASIRQSLTSMKQLFEDTNQGTLLFAFSGHGFQAKGADGQPGRNYLVTTGANEKNLESEALSVPELQQLMVASGARRRVIFVDACRNEPDAKSTDAKKTMEKFQAAEGTMIFLATSPGGYSYEDEELGHGIFTHFVLEALRGKASKDGYVTGYDMRDYLERTVLAHALKKQRIQKVFTTGEHSGDFLLATAAPPTKPEETALPPAAKIVDAETPVLVQVGSGRKVYARQDGGALALFDAETFKPVALLTERLENEKDKDKKDKRKELAATVQERVRRFYGISDNGDVYHVGAVYQGETGDVLSRLQGRFGKPCPSSCIPLEQVPTLPGESLKARGRIGKLTDSVRALAEIFAVWKPEYQGEVIKIQRTQEQAKAVASTISDPTKASWKPYQLTHQPINR
ncbi:MAG: caspase family protein [Bryobacterales bacterium]|nr:caspase family protein [Bryobacterales bacterium]